jgi:hypothetical protein
MAIRHRLRSDFSPISMIRVWNEEYAKGERVRKVRGYWVLSGWEGLEDLTCDFWAENGKRKSRSLRDDKKKARTKTLAGPKSRWRSGFLHCAAHRCVSRFGRNDGLCGGREWQRKSRSLRDDKKKARAGAKAKATAIKSIALPVGIGGWGCPTSQNRDVGHPLSWQIFYTETSRLRNFFAAAVMSTMKRTSRRSWATLNGVSVPVGASAWKAGTCSKVCAMRTKTLK